MAAGDFAVGAAAPHRIALRSAQSVKMSFSDKTACQVSPDSLTAIENLLMPHINTLTDEQQSFSEYTKAQLQASQLGPVLQTLSHGAEKVAAEAQQVLQQYQDVSRSVFGRQWYLSEECQALPVHCV
jgi:hypothetical protein